MKEKLKLFFEIDRIKKDKVYFIFKLFFCFIVAISLFLDSLVTYSGLFENIANNNFNNIKLINIMIFFVAFVVAYILISICEKVTHKIYVKSIYKKNNNPKKYMFVVIWIILLICWLPYLLTFFPGGIYSDTSNTIYQALGVIKVHNHHPILYAFIWSIFLGIGNLFGGMQAGVNLFSIFQALCMSGVLAYSIYWLYKKNVKTLYIVLVTVFFGLYKLIPLYAVSLWKDIPFCLVMLLYSIFIAEIVYEKGKKLENKNCIIKYIILSTLVVFFRNNGIYIVLMTTILLLIQYRKKIKKFAIFTITQIIICIIIQGPIYDKLNLTTEFVENLGIPLQQVCYVVAEDGKITEGQKAFINSLCPMQTIREKYTPCIVDKIKWDPEFNGQFLEENKIKFFEIWLKLFIQNPDSYIKAYLLNTLGYWDINKSDNPAYTNENMWPGVEEKFNITQTDYIKIIFGESIREDLKAKNIVSTALLTLIAVFGMLMCIYHKRYENLLVYVPEIICWATLMVAAPIAFSLRYLYIFVLMIPMNIITIFLNKPNEEN